MHTAELIPFAIAERCGLRLDGLVVTCAGLTMTVDTVPGVAVRLSALLESLRPDTVAVLEAAMWVWGFLPQPPRTITVTTLSKRRLHGLPRHMRNVEFLLGEHDVAVLDGRQVTTPRRTLTDIARFVDDDERASELMSHMCGLPQRDLAESVSSIAPYSPHATRARRRLRAHLADPVHVVDAVNPSNRVEQTLQV